MVTLAEIQIRLMKVGCFNRPLSALLKLLVRRTRNFINASLDRVLCVALKLLSITFWLPVQRLNRGYIGTY
jgi:hypothetical protein